MVNACKPYSGPPLPLFVAGCDAPDGSYWALQSWQGKLPDGGYPPTGSEADYELHLAHWNVPLPTFEAWANWTSNELDRVYGHLVYDGAGVYGFSATSSGNPLDGFGRNVYVDVHDPPWGSGWFRFNSGLTHNPKGALLDSGAPALGGNFCLGMYALYGRTQPAMGDSYRLTVLGSGVMPIQRIEVASPGPFDATTQAAAKANERTFVPSTDSCY
jgi:hypothetical protein